MCNRKQRNAREGGRPRVMGEPGHLKLGGAFSSDDVLRRIDLGVLRRIDSGAQKLAKGRPVSGTQVLTRNPGACLCGHMSSLC